MHAIQTDIHAIQTDIYAIQTDIHAIQIDIHAIQAYGLVGHQTECRRQKSNKQEKSWTKSNKA